jgi:hypothetical protein
LKVLYQILKSSVGFEVLIAVVVKSTIFWDMTPCSPLIVSVSEEYIASIFRVKEYTKQEASLKAGGMQSCLPHALTHVSCSAYSLTLKIEALWSSEMLADFQ